MCPSRRPVPDRKESVSPSQTPPQSDLAAPAYSPRDGPPPASETDEGTYTPSSDRSTVSIVDTEPEFDPTFPTYRSARPPPAFRTPFASLKLQQNDTLVINQFPASTVGLIRGTIIAKWTKGIQKEEPIENGRCFKMKGNPWLVLPQTIETVNACRFLASLLDALSAAGWVLTLTSGSAAGLRQHKATLLFRYQDPVPAPQEWIVLTTLHVGTKDTLRVIDGPLAFRQDLAEALENAAITKKQGRMLEGVCDIELGRHRCTTDNVNLQDSMILILTVLDAHGFTVAASVDQSCDIGKPDTWYCCRARTWEMGMPVFHR